MNSVTSCKEEVLRLCGKYDVSKPSVHEAMKDAENLNKIFSSQGIPLVLESRLVTAVANHPCFVPDNPLNAEVQVNSLLPYLSSPCCWVRSMACSLLRVFASGLDPKGQHIETQVTIICKNLQTTYEESINTGEDTRFQLCQVIACCSLCAITISWAAILPLSAIKFVLLTLRTVLNILSDPVKCSSAFLYQVALDGLGKLLKCPATWNVLSILEKQDTVTEYLHILLDQSKFKDKLADDIIQARMLEVIDIAVVLHTILNLPEKREVGKLLKFILDLLPPISPTSELPLLEVRWKSLSIIYTMLQLAKTQDMSQLDDLFDRACCDSEQVNRLRSVVTSTFHIL
ncbi:uncharacterized protein LOC144632300 [Oculina patagonica]